MKVDLSEADLRRIGAALAESKSKCAEAEEHYLAARLPGPAKVMHEEREAYAELHVRISKARTDG
jgi:hypothetical protein